ncbi:heme NO-binding domain-containing protein [Hymenobacter sp. DG25B]|uniref:heme NO-binding domain-containing protein n=1 Tax=Hymenobacter sp. DG25B TaxID=1385664 RepID=UPI0012E060B9|nr:heme NO-binding domain-containing protein [Hymenobacter sp. DG25B]
MHGTIMTLLKRYVQTQYDHATWVRLVEASGIAYSDFEVQAVYPDQDLYTLVGHAAEMSGVPAEELHEKFGEYLVPDLMLMYGKLVDPTWRTLEMVENTEKHMHVHIRHQNPGHNPPVLQVERLGKNELQVEYVSPRRMGALAVGIIRGLAVYYNEEERIEIEPVTSENGERVSIRVRRN